MWIRRSVVRAHPTVPLQVCRTADFVIRAKTAALRRNFARRPFSACCRKTPNGENPASFGGSLLVRSGDLHFGPQVSVGVCAQAICAFELCSRKNSREKYREESCLLGSSTIRRRRNPDMAGTCYHLGAIDFAQEQQRSLSRWGASTINHPWHATCRTRAAGVVSITHGYGLLDPKGDQIS